MLINTPKTQGICGYIGNTNIAGDNVSITSQTQYGLVTLTTVEDDSDINSSKRLLLTAVGRARNTGTVYGNAADRDKTTDRHATSVSLPPEHRVAVLELGEAPIITEPVTGKISIALDQPEKAKVYVLDDLGNRGRQVKPKVKAGKLEMNLPGDYHSRFMEIAVE